ncbi:MAG: sulfatase [candidate division Zixibacteria bacterium]|nr:sulfatase [candidate division Zixibacteria bacterium]
MKSKILILSILLIVLVTILIISCSSGGKKPNIILIVIDTLRDDHLGYNGYDRNTSPNIDAFSKEGVVFNNAYSQSGWTWPSVASIFTSLYPKDHGCIFWSIQMNNELITLAEVLKDKGYNTFGYPSLFLFDIESGFQQGFDVFHQEIFDLGNPHYINTSQKVNELIFNDLAEIKEPFFIWAHYYDPHMNYRSHKEFVFGDGKCTQCRYDGEIAYTDYHIGRLFTKLKKLNRYDDTIIILTADHGEEFGDHKRTSHYTLFNEVLKTPLIIKAPGLQPIAINNNVSQIDIAPTILKLIGCDIPDEFTGADILNSELVDRPVFAERGDYQIAFQKAVIDGDYKLYDVNIENADTSFERYKKEKFYRNERYFFNKKDDPTEKKNLIADPDYQHKINEFEKHFDTFYGSGERRIEEIKQLDVEILKNLRALGYME